VDEYHKVFDMYGTWGPKIFMGKEYVGVLRTTFLIDPDGNIKRVYENVRPAEHSAELLGELGLA
jgi:thioredoxin-dependent peroxiredoxin